MKGQHAFTQYKTMYVVIRCPGCRSFTYVDRFQRWRLCPICGEATDVSRAQAYVEVDDYRIAETIVKRLEEYLHSKKKSDLTNEEIAELRRQYADWLRSRAPVQ